MVLSRGFPFSDMRRLPSEVNQLFQSAAAPEAGSFSYVNISASPDAIALVAELPGVSEEDLDLSVHRDTLSIPGERKDAGADEGKGSHRRERRVGRFARTVVLPYPVDPDQVEAEMKNGVLRLTLNRPESTPGLHLQDGGSLVWTSGGFKPPAFGHRSGCGAASLGRAQEPLG